MKQPQLFIFDMDGLLLDTEVLFMNLRAKVLEKYGYIHRDEDYIKMLGTAGETMYAIMRDLYGDDYPEAAISRESREAELAYIQAYGATLKPGILSLLNWIQQKGAACCVATSTPSIYAPSFLQSAQIDSYFDFIISGDEVTKSKPNPEIFLLCCERAGISPTDALVLEDSENGVRAAAAAQIPVFCIPDLKHPSKEVAQLATAVLHDANQALSLLRNA